MVGLGIGLTAGIRAEKDGSVVPLPIDDAALPDLIWWLESDIGITLVGNDVSAWDNQAADGLSWDVLSFDQNTASQRPFYNTSVSPQRLNFDGATNEFLRSSGVIGAATHPATMFMVMDNDANAAAIAPGTTTSEEGLQLTDGQSFYSIHDGSNSAPAGAAGSASPRILCGEYDSNASPRAMRLWQNGNGFINYTSGFAVPEGFDQLTMFANSLGLSTGNGWVQALIIYNGLLTQSQKQSVAQTLVNKYPVPSQGDYEPGGAT